MSAWFVLLTCVLAAAVFATSDEQLIHVFPTSVRSEGWTNAPQALEQRLSDSALLDDFSAANSAVIRFAAASSQANAVVLAEDDETALVPESDGDSASSVSDGTTSDVPDTSNDVSANESVEQIGASEEDSDAGVTEENVPSGDEPLNVPAETDSSPTAAHAPTRPIADLTPLSYSTSLLRDFVMPFALAEGDGEVAHEQGSWGTNTALIGADASDEAGVGSDVRVCTVLGTDCNTITFTGFDIGSVLSDHAVTGYTLRLSLAADVEGESVAADKLVVRYFAASTWHLAGEVLLDHSRANEDGGHLAFSLPDLASWDALRDFEVEVEYVRQGTARVATFLDSAWVDVTYEARDEDTLPKLHNVTTELAVLEESGRPDLLVADDQRIELTSVSEDQGDDLIIRSSAAVYDGLTTARAYLAVTNRSASTQTFKLRTHLGTHAHADHLFERVHDQAVVEPLPVYQDVAYFCEGGWHDAAPSEGVAEQGESDVDDTDAEVVETATSSSDTVVAETLITEDVATTSEALSRELVTSIATPTSSCTATGEIKICSAFNEDRTNCIVGEERIAVNDSVRYEGSWQERTLTDAAPRESRSILARLLGRGEAVPIAPHLATIREAAPDFTVMPRETRYFALDLSFPVQQAGEFVVEVDASDAVATKSMWWRSGFKYRVPLTLSTPSRDTATDEVPTLTYVGFDRASLPELFEHASVDAGDVRFYDPLQHTEVPVRVGAYSYLDGNARFGLDIGAVVQNATTSLYLYLGNAYVVGDERRPAPHATEVPIPYAGISEPKDGLVLTVASDRDDLAVSITPDDMPVLVPYGATRDVLLPSPEDRIYATAPLTLRRGAGEAVRGKTLMLSLPEDVHVEQRKDSDGTEHYALARYHEAEAAYEQGVIEELPVPAVGAFVAMQDAADRANYLRMLRGPSFHTFLDELHDFGLGDTPSFHLQYKNQKNTFVRFFKGLFTDHLASVTSVRLFRSGILVEDAVFAVETGSDGVWTLRMTQRPRTIVPGMYTLEISVDEVGTVYTDSFDFYWGVLAINLPQAHYGVDELAGFEIAALDDAGNTLCNADLRLQVMDPEGAETEVVVEPQATCGPNNVTNDPDYRAWYRPSIPGTYTVTLTHTNLAGDIVHQVHDTFSVGEPKPFTIVRHSATRIWPKASYRMEFTLAAAEDFSGQFLEAVPEDFVLLDTGGATTEVWGGAKRLIWDVTLRAGKTQTFSYEYDAPDVSPYLYLLGPAEVRSGVGIPFVDGRAWQVASDVLGSYIELNQALTIASASTWEAKDLTSYGVPANSVAEVAILRTTSGNNTRTGGVRKAGSTLNRYFTITRMTGATNYNAITLTVQVSATSSIEVYGNNTDITFRLLGYWTSGTYTETMQQIDPGITDTTWGPIPLSSYGPSHNSVVEMVVGNFNTGADYAGGVRSASSTVSRLITFSRAINNGITGTTFLATASGTSAWIEGYAQVEGNNNASIDYWLTGYWSSSTVPTGLRYVDRLDTVSVPGSATVWTDQALDSFGVGKYSVAELLIANSGTANSSLDLGVRANGSALARTIPLAQARTGGWNPGRMHVTADNSGSSTIENYVAATANANFRLLGYWRPSDYYPDTPTLYDVPFNNEKTGSSTPYFEFSATDPDGTSDLVYEVVWDDDADLDTSPLGDRTSDDETGCSPNCFVNTVSGGDTSPFVEGNKIRFSLQSTLTTGTTYYWRVRAKDVSGSNTYGEWSTIQSFTYVAGTDPKAWYQTEDAQFDDGTLSSTETYGSNRLRLATTPPTGAMVAYGEGLVQTPRYRTWNGSAWSSESSASDVGGVVSWVVLKAAPTRNEYLLGTQDLASDVNVQVYNGGAGTWGNIREMTTSEPSTDRRGFDIAYQSLSGDAVVVYCDGDADPSYNVWNGTGWSATSSIDLQFNANCNWIKLAPSPNSDEIVLVAQADSTNTTSDFEAQVYTNGTWGNSYTAGANTAGEEYYERMAASYEDSGGEAIVVMGNAGTANFVGATWNSSAQTWTAFTNRTTQDDFEWGELTADDGTDELGLCYADEDNQGHIAKWDGSTNTWDTYDAAGDQIDTALLASGTDYHARPITCKYEVTAGRDGYLMIPYSDATNGRYRVWNGTSLTSEASISTLEDSWTAGSARTGDGKVLTVWRDNTNARYDFSYWSGSAWSSRETLNTSVSDTAEPYGEPIAVTATRYQQSTGSILSPIVDFDIVPGQQTWGEALWTTTEPTNTDTVLQVLYASAASTTCTALVPDGALAGNSTGFTSTSSPLDLSGLSTSTYNRLCLKLTLTSNSSESPTLDDWTMSWERQPYLTETHYRWYANADSLSPSDAWPSGTNKLVEDEAIPASYAPSSGDVLRLRLGLADANVTLAASSTSFKLQWAEGQTCSASLTWTDVGAIGSSVPWRGYDNTGSGVLDGATLPSRLLATTDVSFSYEEENNTATNTAALASGEEAELDFVLLHAATSSTYYCFRLINADGTVLNGYDRYPQLITNAPPSVPTLESPFPYEALASTTPFFIFVAEDGKGDDIHYEVEVDDDIAFDSLALDRNSEDHFNEFTNIANTADKSPFTSGQSVRFVPTSALSNNTTYWWRVRARDPTGSNTWSGWSDPQSFTASSTISISTWYQTTYDQFAEDEHELTEATSTHDIVLTPPNTAGTSTSPAIEFSWRTSGNAWGSLSWTDNEATGDIRYHIEYYNGSSWSLIPDSILSGNAAGYGTGAPISLLGVDPTTYNTIRIRANFTYIGGSPRLNDWKISWGLAVEQPTLLSPFDHEKVGTTTPSFTFYSSDPESQDLQYEFQWSTTSAFTTATTSTSSAANSAFVNTASSTNVSPFISGDTIRFTATSGSAMLQNGTYWWRVRARDPSGGNTWSVWSPTRSFTVNTSVTVSTWFQTTDEQFTTGALTNTEVYGSNQVRITSTIREALVAYAEGVVQTPRYRLWNGSAWGTEKSAENIGERIYWLRTEAAPTRNEYVMISGGLSGAVKAQVYAGGTATWGNLTSISVLPAVNRRGLDVMYETVSGDAIAVACYGTDATYSVWNGSSWSATSTINLGFTQNCEWVELASDPTSDEVILVARANTANAPYAFEAQVWNGSSWGNSTTQGLMEAADAENIGMDVEYEESGGDAVLVTSNGTNANFHYRTWNGSIWSATSSVTTADDLETPKLKRDLGSDNLVLCYVANNNGIYYTTWGGASFVAPTLLSIDSNSKDGGHSFGCEYETTSGRDGYLMFPYTDTIDDFYRYYSTALQPETALTTIQDSWAAQTVRTGDGNILVVFYDETTNTQYDFTYWNGSSWAPQQTLETNVSAFVNPIVPLDMSARRYTSFTSGSVVSDPIVFSSGTGPRWGVASSTDLTPGSSYISYQFEYSTDDGETWSLIPDAALPGNSVGTTSNSIDLSSVSYATYGTIRYVANFVCVAGDCPTLQDWTVAWSEGITISGTAKAYDETTNVTTGTVKVAVNSTLQSGKQGTIAGGTWNIPNVTMFPGDVITVFIDGVADANEAAAVTRYDGYGNMTGIELYERHLTVGSPDATTTTNADIARYDYSTSSDEDLFFDVDTGNDLYVCAPASGSCADAKLFVATTSTYRPDSANSGTLYAHDVVINGTTTADSNTFYVSGSWDANGRFDSGNGTVIMTATSSSETLDSNGAIAYAFNTLTLGQSGSATWTAQSLLDVNGAFTLAYGTYVASTSGLVVGGDLSLAAGTTFVKGTGTTTFDGATIAVITDATAQKQDLGKIAINGASKTVRLGAALKLTDLWVETSNTFDVSSNNYALEITGDYHNHGSFSARAGTVNLTATTTGRTIDPGNSSFYNLTASGTGAWSFEQQNVSITNNLTIATGTLTLAVGTTTLSGNLINSGGAFIHNNGTLELIGSGSKTLTQNNSPLYNVTTNGSGSWSWSDTSATTSGTVRLLNGTLTFPTGTLTIGKSLRNLGGTILANAGTTRYTSATSEVISTNGSALYSVTVDGVGGTFTLSDTNLVASGTVQLLSGTTTFPTGTLTIGGSFNVTSGTWSANGGAVLFTSLATGRTVNPGSGSFSTVTFNSSTGGWTVTANATSTGAWTLTNAQSFTAQSGVTIEVGGTFINSIPASTTWTGATLYLNSGTSYTVGSKTQVAEGYGTLRVGANTDIRMWQSSSTAYAVDSTGSLVSQDHAAVDGDLYIYGTYERTSGTEYWSYATDFDGTALGGSSRQVAVRLANGASAQYAGASLQVLGGVGATTTIANQGSGSYNLSVHDGTVQAQYYAMTDLGSDGFSILGSSTVSSLSDGSYTLTTNGGTMVTVSSTTIDANPTLQVFRVAFATSSGVSSGYNVTASGTASSYWWFRDHSGTYDGESFDNDPVAGAGSIRWDDSGFTISISGTVYAGEGSGGAPAACNGSTNVLRLVVNGVTPYDASCVAGSGTFTFPAVTYTGDVPLVLYLNDSAGTRGATVSRSPQSNINGFDLYQNRVIVRHEGPDATAIATMLPYDSDQDTDIPFDAETGTFALEPEFGLYLWPGKTFAPGGSITLNSGGSGAPYDGTIRLAAASTFSAAGSESHSIGGSFIAETGATFVAANSTVTFTATTSGKIVAPASSFYNATFSGSGGWTIASSTTVANNLTVSAGTVSGTENVTIQNGSLSGNGIVTMTGGTVLIQKGGTFGGNSAWTFSNLSFGDGTLNSTTKAGSGDIAVTGTLTVAASHTLDAGSVVWTLSGSGAVLSVAGTFTPSNSTTTFAGTGAMTVPALTYRNLVLAPNGVGSPTYTLSAGTLLTHSLTAGNGVNPVTIDVTTSDPLLTATGTVRIKQSATYSASNANDLQIGGSYVNQGTFTSNGGGVLFNSSDSGETVDPGGSSFHHVTFNAAGGGWTMLANATSTGNFTLTSGTYVQTSGTTLAVQGMFTNTIGGALTTWSGTTLSLSSGTSYSMNTKSAGGDVYSTLSVGANTDIKMWNSTSSVYAVAPSGSLVSQDHNTIDGALYVWGDYDRSSGSEYWSYATDFDGTDISGSPRVVSVRLAPNATTTLSGGTWSITGAAGATTTIATMGGGTYALRVTGGTFSAQYYRIRDISATGLEFSGSPIVNQLSDGDLELAINGGTMLTVPASVITANPAKTWYRISFATSSGVTSGKNATSSGATASLWRFTPASGNYYGEQYDGDPAGDPGYLVWDDSNAQVTIAGKVYSGEGSGVSSVCNGSSPVVRMVIQGGSPQTTSCAVGGDYAFTGVTYSPGDSILVYIDGTSTRAANITVDPLTSISDFDLYEHRVIVRHEDTTPITIDDLAIYDSSDDVDIPFTAVSGSPDTLTLPADHKLIVWTGKTFTPGGNVTLTSGGTGTSYDGTLELQANARYISSSATSESISVGGSWLTGSGALFTAGSSTVTFTATTSGKTVSPDTSPFYNLVFNGSGGAWTFADRDATTTRSFTITAGNVTLGTSTLAVGGSFVNSATMSAASTSITFSSSSAATVTFGSYPVGSLTFAGTGSFTMTDTNATSTGSVSITAGSVALPSGTFAVANGFSAQGGIFTHAGTIRLYGSLAAQTLRFGTSQARHLTIAGTGSWAFADTNATTTGTTTIASGGLTAPAGGFGIGGSFLNYATFNANGGQVNFFATTSGQMLYASSTVFANILIAGVGGGWTFATSASTTGSFRLHTASSFAMAASTTLEVRGSFENLVGGASTTFATSTLFLNSGTSYTVNSKSAGGDSYAYLTLGNNTDVRMWDSAAATTTVATSSSLYSMDHAGVSGDLSLWGEYVQSSGSDYWSYATDFDGTALGGSSRQVDVRIASSSSLSFTGGTLEIVGTASATTTLAVMGSGAYSFAKSGGSLTMQYYEVKDLDSAGIVLSGPLSIASLSYGSLELSRQGGILLQVASSTIDQNPSKSIVGIRFATTSGISGTNVQRNGATANFWDFSSHYGEIDGETYDTDGADACGAIRWDDSICLEVSQAHYRFRNDDGSGGAPDSEWYDANWNKRKRVNVTNSNGSVLTNAAVRFDIGYDADMQSDWDDLRFTDSSGTTSIPYFVERYTVSATATVWVKVPSIPANGSTFVYAYYSNAFATNGESGASTFTFFDDFEDDNISEYSGDTGYFDAVSNTGAEGGYILEAAAGYENSQTADGIYRTGTTFGQGSTVRWMQYVTASQDDEPCTLFGVQTPGTNNQNYAVCLDQYPSDKLVLAKNVSSNDASGSVLASSTVSWTSQWYTIEVDWLTNNTIYVSVYNSSGALSATTTASDSSYTSGGMGFSFWYEHDGWDFYTVRPYVVIEPTISAGPEQGKGGASWKAAQDTAITQDQGQPFRVRFSVENSGLQITDQEWRLQYADKTGYGTCNAVPSVDFDDVLAQAGCGVNPICLTTTSHYADSDPTQELLTSTTFYPSVEGYLVESPSNQTPSMTLDQNRLTEVEYAIELTENAVSNAYCLRTSDGGLELDSYQTIAEVTANYGPQVSAWTFNESTLTNPNPIALIEGQTTVVVATGTVTDLNGFEDLLYATSTFYRSGVGAGCSEDLNNCYQLNSLECPLDNCSGTTCEVTCSADIQYFADPTDAGSYVAEEWRAKLYVVDTTNNEASSTSDGAELLTLWGVGLTTGAVSYGSLDIGQDTGSYNATTTLKNTGNDSIDIELDGTDMTAGVSSIPAANQKYATTTFTYASCVICSALSGTASTLEVDLPKPTSTSSPVTDDLYWGVYVPMGSSGATHNGHTTFYATGD